jgi:hypothetical protein
VDDLAFRYRNYRNMGSEIIQNDAVKPACYAIPTTRQHSSGSLDSFDPVLVTPVIGNEFRRGTCNIVDDILNAPNADQRIRDLAIMGMFHTSLSMLHIDSHSG